MGISDSLFKKIEEKTSVSKESIMNIANSIQSKDLKDANVLNNLINDIAHIAGKEVSEEQKNKIINAVVNDKVPENLDKFVD